MNRAPRAWVLNLDAESELAAPRRYAPTRHLREIVERERAKLVATLLAPGDVLVTDEGLRGDPTLAERVADLEGVAWSPTPTALALLARAGARVPGTPSLEVLRTVNARPFAAAVREPFARSSFAKQVVTTREAALAQLALPAELGWLVRRTFGAAGRGRRRIHAGKPDAGELAWLDASLALGPLVIEPWVQVTTEFTRSGWVGADGVVTISRPCFQRTTEQGAWIATERAPVGEVAGEDDRALAGAFEAAGRALAGAGYVGPFGIDAYRHRRTDGRPGTVLNPLSEINARFTMDWALALSPTEQAREAGARLDGLLEGAGGAS